MWQQISIGSGNGLAPNRCQAIAWTIADLFSLHFWQRALVKLQNIMEMHLKMFSAICQPFCLGHMVYMWYCVPKSRCLCGISLSIIDLVMKSCILHTTYDGEIWHTFVHALYHEYGKAYAAYTDNMVRHSRQHSLPPPTPKKNITLCGVQLRSQHWLMCSNALSTVELPWSVISLVQNQIW